MFKKFLLTTLVLTIINIGSILASSRSSLIIHNTDSTENPVSDVKIELYKGNKKVDSAVSDSTGDAVFEHLETGSYTALVTSVPDEYQVFDSKFEVNITNTRQLYQLDERLVFKKYGTISIYRSDINGNPLSGGEVTVYDKDGEVVDVLVADENGNAESMPLEEGTYYLKETKPIEGYLLDENIYEIYVGSGFTKFQYEVVSVIDSKKNKQSSAEATNSESLEYSPSIRSQDGVPLSISSQEQEMISKVGNGYHFNNLVLKLLLLILIILLVVTLYRISKERNKNH